MNKLRFACAAWLALAATFAMGQQDSPEFVTEVEGISEYRLDNGMKVLLMPDASRPTTTVNVTYFVGSKHESYGETGMAHLLEHLVFMGTPNHEDIKKEISERGGFANGTTWWERTNYFQTLPAGEENLEWSLRMEADRMVNSFIAKEDLDSEMTVVRNEFEIGENNPFRVLLQRVMGAAYDWHGYGRSTIGARSDLENVPIERLQRFYRQYYQPDNAMVVISGKFEPERALALVEQYFGAIPTPERTLDNKLWETYTRDPAQDGPREVTVRRSGGVPTLMLAYHIPSALHDDFAAVEA
ncbi:MAG: M16 family metallopeptidase, partial [Wenzhouxiangellaceae bacterium]